MLLIRNGYIVTMDDRGTIEGGDILIDNDRIAAVGEGLKADGAQTIDAKGLFIMPGLIDAHCHVGMWEDTVGSAGSDGNESTNPVTPQLRAIDAINPVDRCFREALESGVTLVATGPGSANVIGGQFVAMRTAGGDMDGMIVKEPLALKTAFGENPKRVYAGKGPSTRMATAAVFREAFVEAQEYMKKMDNPDPDKRPARDLKKEILVQALKGELIVKSHAHRADDIATALRLGREFGLRQSIEHCTEGYLMLDALKKANVPCILGPLLSDRSKIELGNKTFKAPAAFEKAGVKFALMTDHPVIPLEYLMVEAAVCVREGLSEMGAFRSMTLSAAEAIGLEKDYGSLTVGKKADIALFDGNPLDTRNHTKMVISDGKVVFER